MRYRVAHAAAVSRQDALEQMLHGHVPSGTEPTHGAVIVSKLPLPKLQWNPFIVATAGNPDPLVSYTFSQLVAIMIEADLLLHQ